MNKGELAAELSLQARVEYLCPCRQFGHQIAKHAYCGRVFYSRHELYVHMRNEHSLEELESIARWLNEEGVE